MNSPTHNVHQSLCHGVGDFCNDEVLFGKEVKLPHDGSLINGTTLYFYLTGLLVV